jgi:hypothetical protein
MSLLRHIGSVTSILILAALSSAQTKQTKPTPVGIRVEAEGGGHGQGMWSQAADDLTPRELKDFESLLVGAISKEEGVKVVPSDDPDDYVAVVVVAAKLPNCTAGTWYIASTAIAVAARNGTDELVTHDVVAEEGVNRTV